MPSRRSKKSTKPPAAAAAKSNNDNVARLTPLGTPHSQPNTTNKQKIIFNNKRASTVTQSPLCRFFAVHGNCRYGDSCAFSHDVHQGDVQTIVCPFFLKGNCRYGDACRLSHCVPDPHLQRNQEEITTCGICLEQPKKFGLLSGCNHVFCFSCLMEWRTSCQNNRDSSNQQVRACPECRNHSDYVIPSPTFAKSGEGKEEIIASYKTRLSKIPCKHFSGELGSCPFGRDCFYLHLNDDGIDIKEQDKSLKEIHAALEQRRERRDLFLDDELEHLENFLIMLHLYGSGRMGNMMHDDWDSDSDVSY